MAQTVRPLIPAGDRARSAAIVADRDRLRQRAVRRTAVDHRLAGPDAALRPVTRTAGSAALIERSSRPNAAGR